MNGVLNNGDIEKSIQELPQYNDESFQKIYTFLYTLNLCKDLFKIYAVNKAFDVRILSVDSKFRGQGIANQLIAESEKVARANNFKVQHFQINRINKKKRID